MALTCICGHYELDHDMITFTCTERPCPCSGFTPCTYYEPHDMYSVPCPECGQRFGCESLMHNHQTSHRPQPRAFLDLALDRIAHATDTPDHT